MVSQAVREENSYETGFRELQDSLLNPRFTWVARLRESAWDRFEQLGFPSATEEEWKYTSVAPLVRMGFSPVLTDEEAGAALSKEQLTAFTYPEAKHSRLVFVNGRLHLSLSSLSALPQGVVAVDLASALDNPGYGEIVREHLARRADYNEDSFTALNTAFISHGAFLLIPEATRLKPPVHLLFLTDPSQPRPATFPRVLVVAEENSAATIIESYASVGDDPHFTNGVVEIVLADGARLDHYKVQREGTQAFHVASTAADLGRNSSFNTTAVTLGAHLSRNNIHVTLDHEGAECRVDGLYIVGAGQLADTHSVIDHRKPHCTSRQLYKGILDGKSRAVFSGKIFVRHGAEKTDAMQTNKNLLLSNEARVDTKPQLEILADDVKCAHGAAVGQLDDEEIFYLESRGIQPDLARNLLTYGFAEEVIAKISVESIKAQLDESVLRRLKAQLDVR